MIQKTYEVDPLICPKCLGPMKIISTIEDPPIIEKILKRLGLWDIGNHDPPAPQIIDFSELTYLPVRDRTQTGDDSFSQVPPEEYWIQ